MTLISTQLQIPAGDYTVDPSHSRVGFVARHAMVTKVRGSFNDFSATAHIGEDIRDSRVSVTIKADSIDTRNQQRDGHLRGNDFLDIANHPEIRFESTQVELAGDDLVRVLGDLSIRGVTRPV